MSYKELTEAYRKVVYEAMLWPRDSDEFKGLAAEAKRLQKLLIDLDRELHTHYKHSQLGNYPYPD